jgi:hypothetical protein
MTDLPGLDDARYGLNAAKVACQVLDGEAIVIHFERGHYYSAAGSGALLLGLLSEGSSVAELGSALVRRFELEPEQAACAVVTFLRQLWAEELLVTISAGAAERSASPTDLTPMTSFEEPRLVKYTDLEDLLILDPVHEVMLSAWPAGGS